MAHAKTTLHSQRAAILIVKDSLRAPSSYQQWARCGRPCSQQCRSTGARHRSCLQTTCGTSSPARAPQAAYRAPWSPAAGHDLCQTYRHLEHSPAGTRTVKQLEHIPGTRWLTIVNDGKFQALGTLVSCMAKHRSEGSLIDRYRCRAGRAQEARSREIDDRALPASLNVDFPLVKPLGR